MIDVFKDLYRNNKFFVCVDVIWFIGKDVVFYDGFGGLSEIDVKCIMVFVNECDSI